MAEFNIASIDCWAAFEVFATARVATGCPQTCRADQEREQDQV